MVVRPIDAVQVLHNINLHHIPTPVSEFESGFNNGLNKAMWEIAHAPTLTTPNEQLTLEQLREMDGEPVYIISEFYHMSEWNIPNGIGEIVIAYDVPCAGMKEVIPSIKFIDGKELAVEKYGSSWVAYRRLREHGAGAGENH